MGVYKGLESTEQQGAQKEIVISDRRKPFAISKDNKRTYEKVDFRFKQKRYAPPRVDTGVESFDEWTGGLPVGLTLIAGEAGSGKSLLSRLICQHYDVGPVVFIYTEVSMDSPDPLLFPHVKPCDYTIYQPNAQNAYHDLELIVDRLQPAMVVIDSITNFFSITNKAVSEADIRDSVGQVHTTFDGVLPIIATSEIRGVGFNEAPAGGRAVEHKCAMLVETKHQIPLYKGMADALGVGLGQSIYTIQVKKDKGSLSKTNLGKVTLTDSSFKISSITPTRGRDD